MADYKELTKACKLLNFASYLPQLLLCRLVEAGIVSLLYCTDLWPNYLQLWQQPQNDAAPPNSIGTKPDCAPYLTATVRVSMN